LHLLLTRDIPAITKADRTGFGGFAGEFCAFKTQADTFLKGAIGNFTEFVFSGLTAVLAVRTEPFGHPGTFFAGNTANTYLHFQSPE
jgi:hypothetical protein